MLIGIKALHPYGKEKMKVNDQIFIDMRVLNNGLCTVLDVQLIV